MANTPIIPLNDRVLVERVAEREKSKAGLFIPEVARDTPCYGVVHAIGDRVKSDMLHAGGGMSRKVMVLFGKYAGTEVPGLPNYLLLREEEILGVASDSSNILDLLEHGA